LRQQRAERQQIESAILMAQQGGEAARSVGQGMKEIEGIALPTEEGVA